VNSARSDMTDPTDRRIMYRDRWELGLLFHSLENSPMTRSEH